MPWKKYANDWNDRVGLWKKPRFPTQSSAEMPSPFGLQPLTTVAVRNTRDINLLLGSQDLDRATEALSSVGFIRDRVMNATVFLDGPDGKPSQGIHILLAGQKVKDSYASPTPRVDQSQVVENKTSG